MLDGGWLRTGDIGHIDADGFIFIEDRKKDVIVVSGFKVYPNEIEDVAATQPGVREVAAIGVPDKQSGESVKLFIVRSDPKLTEADVIAHARANLTGYKVPRHVEFLDELPEEQRRQGPPPRPQSSRLNRGSAARGSVPAALLDLRRNRELTVRGRRGSFPRPCEHMDVRTEPQGGTSGVSREGPSTASDDQPLTPNAESERRRQRISRAGASLDREGGRRGRRRPCRSRG